MSTLSIELPDELAQATEEVAKSLGVSRSELIRRALARELDTIRATQERQAMAESFRAMKNDDTYMREAEALDAALDETLPQETDRWWGG